MKKLFAILLSVASLACIVLMVSAILGNQALGTALQHAALPIVGALVTAFGAGKLFAAEESNKNPLPNQA